MSEYMDVYVRKGEKLSEEELEWLKGFQKAWEWQSWRIIEQWFGFNGKVIDSMVFSAILKDYLKGIEKPLIDALEEALRDEHDRYSKVEAVEEIYRKIEFLMDLLDVFLICGSKVAVGSEYLEDEEWIKFEGG